MDIRDIPHRHHAHAAHSRKEPAAAASDVAETETEDGSSTASTDGAASGSAGASSHKVSQGGRFLNFLQAFEDKHPAEAKRILSGIADKLRADAEHAGPWAGRLERWADKVQKAADTGDMSNLVPAWQQHAHYGVQAYQKAQGAPDDGALQQVASSLPAAASDTPAPATTAETASPAPAAPSSSDAPTTAAETPSVTTPIIAGTPAATGSTETKA